MNFLRRYNVTLDLSTAGSMRVRIPLRKAGTADFATGSDWTPGAGDVVVFKDGGASANIGTLPTYSNGRWEFTLSATELSCRAIDVNIVDAAVDSDGFTVETYGNASAMYPSNYVDVVRMGMTALPNAAADAAGGLPISDAGGLDLDAKLANTNEVTAARMGALTDWINGGRLDLILDIIAADTTADIPALIDALPTAAENAAALLDLTDGIETGVTPRQALRYIAAATCGIASGAATSTIVFKAIGAASNGTTRLTATTDSDGNRSAITLA